MLNLKSPSNSVAMLKRQKLPPFDIHYPILVSALIDIFITDIEVIRRQNSKIHAAPAGSSTPCNS
jgi:hypothetical protein